jgi:transketolase
MSMTDLATSAVPKVVISTNDAIDQLCVNTIRTLAMDAVQAANSDRPGTPMALAPVVYCLWQRVLRFDPSPSGLITLRPADANEAVEAWRVIAELRHEPVALILTRQAVPTLDRSKYASTEGVRRGAYVLADADDGRPQVLLLSTGSEVALCVEAYEKLKTTGINARVVSMPSWEIFEHYCRDHPEYREEVLPESIKARVSVEQGSTLGWAGYVGRRGHSIGMETFGASAPLKELQKKFGFTVENVIAAAKQQIAAAR